MAMLTACCIYMTMTSYAGDAISFQRTALVGRFKALAASVFSHKRFHRENCVL
jgi:hypothetical protein